MKRLGEVVRTAQGLAIVRSPDQNYPDIGTAVVDEGLEEVGRVVDIFGPVERPYVAVSSERERIAPLVGSPVYGRD